MTEGHPHLRLVVDGGVAVVTIDRPEQLNAVNRSLHRSFAEIWRELRTDPDVRAVVLTGEGQTFCAGADFDYIESLTADAVLRDATAEEAGSIVTEMLRFAPPIIAAVNGPAVGLGCSVAILCDIVLISDRAHLADPHVALGLVAGDGGAAMWPLLTSLLRSKEHLYTGDRIPAEEAVALGLATRVVAHDRLREEALALAHRLARLPAVALQDTKRAVNAHLEAAVAGPLRIGLAAERISLASDEAREALAALRASSGAR